MRRWRPHRHRRQGQPELTGLNASLDKPHCRWPQEHSAVTACQNRWRVQVLRGGYLISFAFLAAPVSAGMPLGIAYGVSIASDIVLTALLPQLMFDEAPPVLMSVRMAVIVGVVQVTGLGS